MHAMRCGSMGVMPRHARHPRRRAAQEGPRKHLTDEGAADDLLRRSGSVSGHLLAGLDGLHDVHAFADLAEHGVVAVDHGVATVVMKNCEPPVSRPALAIERMRAGRAEGVRPHGICQPGPPVPRDATWGPGVGAAALQHEVRNDAVEVEAVVVALAHELAKLATVSGPCHGRGSRGCHRRWFPCGLA